MATGQSKSCGLDDSSDPLAEEVEYFSQLSDDEEVQFDGMTLS